MPDLFKEERAPTSPGEEAYLVLARARVGKGFVAVDFVAQESLGQGDASMLTVMAKMGSDYDPDNGNWYYGVLSVDGSKAMKEGKIEMCIDCRSTGTDFLFGAK